MDSIIKVGILTYHFSDNFGAAWQAYATRQWLIDRGYKADFINYCPSYVEHGGRFLPGITPKKLKANLKIAYLHGMTLRTRLFGHAGQRRAFDSFRRNELGVTGRIWLDYNRLNEAVADYDILITGSDQIWNPSIQMGLDPAYFLDFPTFKGRRFSFAASFGNATLAGLRDSGAARLLMGLDAISVREERGVSFVKELSGRPSLCVMDPTCLVDDYSKVMDRPTAVVSNKYVFCYALRTDHGVRDAAHWVSSDSNLPIYTPSNPLSRWRPIGHTLYPGPREWLGLIANSACVVTNSFHGTMFSILSRRPFVVIGLSGRKEGLNERMVSLLGRLGLQDRIIVNPTREAVIALMRCEIDWSAVSIKMDTCKHQAESFLREQLKKIQECV